MVFQNDILAGSSGGTGTSSAVHTIGQSIRFNDADNPALSKTFSGAGTNTTWTFSCWIKLGVKTSNGRRMIFSAGSAGSNYGGAELGSTGDDSLEFYNYYGGSYDWRLVTTHQFRDPSAWYHLVFVSDTTNPIPTERARIYVNGQRVTSFTTESYPSLNYANNFWMGTTEHDIGTSIFTTMNFDGYMAEIVNIDGTALDPSSFGLYNDSNIWIPRDVSSLSFGSNGFHIKGEDSADLGNDSSGNNNDATTSGLSSDDQQPDSPTNNHCTWNPIEAETLITYSNGNLAIAYSGSSGRNAGRSTIKIPASTDAFFEMVMTSNLGSGVDFFIGIEDGTAQSDNINSIYNNAYIIREDGSFLDQSSRDYSYGTSFTNTDVLGVWRKANGDLVFYKNGTAMNSGTPAKTGLTGTMFFVAGAFNGSSAEARFASSKWTNKPSGVTDSMALNTKNLGG